MFRIEDLSVGDTVEVNSGFGSGPLLIGVVEGLHPLIKNGKDGITYAVIGREDQGLGKWAYISQIKNIISKAKSG